MFEGDTNIGLLNTARLNQMAAYNNGKQAQYNLESLNEWKQHARVCEGRITELHADVEAREVRISKLNEDAKAREVRIAELEKICEKNRIESIVNLAKMEGYKVMYGKMKSRHCDSSFLADTDYRYNDGSIKTHANIMFDCTFDRIMIEHKMDSSLYSKE